MNHYRTLCLSIAGIIVTGVITISVYTDSFLPFGIMAVLGIITAVACGSEK